MRRAALLLVALLVVGTVTPVVGAGTRSGSTDRAAAVRADPPTDRIGWEDGYWHDDAIDVDQSDGLSDAELDAYVGRAMARVEYLRDAEFGRSVPVSVIGREAFRGRSNGSDGNRSFAAWNNQVWEALFVDGEDRNVQRELDETYGQSVAGFYAPGDDEIKIVTDSPDSPTIDNATLIHELVHAWQDQTVDLTSARLHGDTQDESLAIDGLVEGEANLIESLYERRCGAEWTCVATPRAGGGGGGGQSNLALLLTILQPYSDGPVYVNWLRERGGWAAVRAAYADPPASTEQVIHRTDERPRPVSFTDRARNGWTTYPGQGENGSDTVGEASMYVMFWHQARAAGADTVDPQSISRTSSPFDLYNYDALPSAGWANDRLFPYRNGPPGGNDTRHGYVWVTEWDTVRDAREFRRAYGAILDAHDARTRADGIRVVPTGPFADAFYVVRRGTRVVVVNGPTPAAVGDIRPGLVAAGGDGSDAGTGGSTGVAPGFGVGVAVGALLAAVLVALGRGRRRD